MTYNASDTTANVRCTPCARVIPAADRVAHDLVAHHGVEHTGRYAQVPAETRTETEAIADILAALHRRVRNAEWDYDMAQKMFPVGSAERREARGIRDEAVEASLVAQRIAGTVA